jgi:cytoskeletal protein CcmA (bactofilin family)
MTKEGKKMKIFSKETDQINGLLDKGCSFEGKLTFDGVVQINGDFKGDIFSDGTLIVGRDARVMANILVDTLIIDGRVEGIAEAKSKVEIHSAAQFLGEVVTPRLSVEEGGILQGTSRMQPVEHIRAAKTPDKPASQEEDYFVQTTDDPLVM